MRDADPPPIATGENHARVCLNIQFYKLLMFE